MATKSKFQFKNYTITKSIFDFVNIPELNDLKLGTKLSGEIDNEHNTFKLKFGLHITDKEGLSNILVESTADYTFKEELAAKSVDDIDDIFYLNSIALLFPHIRAYITSLTALSGNKPLILPTINVALMKNDLKENIIIR